MRQWSGGVAAMGSDGWRVAPTGPTAPARRVRHNQFEEGKGCRWSSPGEGNDNDKNRNSGEVDTTPMRYGARA
jgi:hypothetical protein